MKKDDVKYQSNEADRYIDIDIVDDNKEENYVKNMLNVSNELDPIDAEEKSIIGDRSVSNFYAHFKGLNKVTDQNNNTGVPSSVYTGMLNICSKKLLLPLRAGVIKNDGNAKTLDLRNYMLGNNYIGVAAEGIKRIDYDTVDIRNNRLGEKGAKRVLNNLRTSHKSIDMSVNKMGRSTEY